MVVLNLPKLKSTSPQALAAGALWATLLDVGLVLAGVAAAVQLWAPAQDIPWKPFRLAAPPGLASRVQFARVASDPAACRAVLAEGGVRFSEAQDRTQGFCEVRNAVRLTDGLLPGAPAMTCPMALATAAWTRHVVQPAAGELFQARVARVDHYGTYACRNVYGRAQGRPSEHAFANALDVAGFRLADGRRLSVAADFRDEGARGAFLLRVRDGACPWFRSVLSPDYNAAHADHLHLDFGRYSVCR